MARPCARWPAASACPGSGRGTPCCLQPHTHTLGMVNDGTKSHNATVLAKDANVAVSHANEQHVAALQQPAHCEICGRPLMQVQLCPRPRPLDISPPPTRTPPHAHARTRARAHARMQMQMHAACAAGRCSPSNGRLISAPGGAAVHGRPRLRGMNSVLLDEDHGEDGGARGRPPQRRRHGMHITCGVGRWGRGQAATGRLLSQRHPSHAPES